MHINVKPLDRNQVYMSDRDAIQHLWIYQCYAKTWDGGQTMRNLGSMRLINEAIKAKSYEAFKASKRRGYWRIELA